MPKQRSGKSSNGAAIRNLVDDAVAAMNRFRDLRAKFIFANPPPTASVMKRSG